MEKIKIYHNNSCSKSRTALKEITQSGNEFEIINYLVDVPSIADLEKIIAKLNIKPFELVRKTEKLYIENFKGKNLSNQEWIVALHQNPILIQRPIVVNGGLAVIARNEEELDKVI